MQQNQQYYRSRQKCCCTTTVVIYFFFMILIVHLNVDCVTSAIGGGSDTGSRMTLVQTNTMSTLPMNHTTTSVNNTDNNKKSNIPLPFQRPSFVQHVTKDQIRIALQVAQQRHEQSIQRAKSKYPVYSRHQPQYEVSPSSSSSTDTSIQRVKNVQLKEYSLSSNDDQNKEIEEQYYEQCLPDYHDLIPTTIYVTDPPILTPDECQDVIQRAEEYFASIVSGMTNNNTDIDSTISNWTTQQSGQYNIAGFDLCSIPKVKEWFLRISEQILLPLLQQTFTNFCNTDNTNENELYIDHAYLFKYTPSTGRRTDIHTDSGCLSFTIALNSPNGIDYDGGGTWFYGLQQANHSSSSNSSSNILSMDIGQITIRPGGIKHCGYAVTNGTRYIIGGFCIHQSRPEYVRMLLQPPQQEESFTTTYDTTTTLSPIECYEAAIVLNPRCTAAYNLLANQYIQKQNPVKALEVLLYCIQHVDPLSSEVAYAIASIYLQKEMYDVAYKYIQICLHVDDQDVEAIMMAASIVSYLDGNSGGGGSTREEQYYSTIIQIPDVKSSIKASAYCNLGVLYQGKDIEMEYYQQSIACKPNNNFSAKYSLASAYASRQLWNDAIQMYQESILDIKEQQQNDIHGNGSIDKVQEHQMNYIKALRSLYTATMQYIQEEQQQNESSKMKITTRDEMMQQFQSIMGHDNFLALQQQQQQK